jgi:predicted phosphodiesterase
MKKIQFIFILIFTLITTVRAELHLGPYLQNVTPTSIEVMWETTEPAIGILKYGISGSKLSHSVREQESRKLHTIIIDNLHPNTVYDYRCIWQGDSTKTFNFKTAPQDPSIPVRIMIYGDSRSAPERHEKVIRSAAENHPDLVVNTGDLVGYGSVKKLWKKELFDPASLLMTQSPYYAVPGNHEEESPLYYSYFTMGGGKKWWSADFGSVHLIGLNTNVDGSPGSLQYEWLVQDLIDNQDKPWIFVFMHNPMFHVHPFRPVYEERYYWHPLFMEYGVDMVFSGHDHYYLRTHPIGRMGALEKSVVYFTVAGGGAPLYTGIDKPFKAFFLRDYHYSILDIDAEKIVLKGIDIEGKLFDSYEVHQGNKFSPVEYVDYGVYELEKELLDRLGSIYPDNIMGSRVGYDVDFKVLPAFSETMRYEIDWEVPGKWDTEQQQQEIILAPGDSLGISFVASAPVDDVTPTPTLRIHIDFSDSSGATRFLNQDIVINMEQAASLYAQSAGINEHNKLFKFLKKYPYSWFGGKVLQRLYRLAFYDEKKSMSDSAEKALSESPSVDNQFRFYPIQFIYGDFSRWDAWLESMENLSPLQRELAPGSIFQLTYLRDLNTRFVDDWDLFGTFEPMHKETIMSPDGTPYMKHTVKSDESVSSSWQKMHTDSRHFLDIGAAFPSRDINTAYAYTNLKASRPGEVVLLIGNNSDITIWVNGEEAFQRQSDRHATYCQEVLRTTVKEGINHIVFQTAYRYDEWGLYLQIADKDLILQ